MSCDVRVRFLDIDGVPTRVLTAGGSGPAALLLHGIGLSADIWEPTLSGLAQEVTLHAPDLLWHGFTGGPPLAPGRSPHPPMLDHLERTADALGLREFAVIGSSFGALLAALLHLRRPERVTKLVIVGSGSCFDDEPSLLAMLEKAHANAARAIRAGTWEAWRRRLENICFAPDAVTPAIIAPLVTAYAVPGSLERFEHFMSARRDIELERPYRVTERLEEMVAPTLVIWGRQEMRGDIARAEEAVRQIPSARLIAYDECGHLPFMEQVSRFNEDMREFLCLDGVGSSQHRGG